MEDLNDKIANTKEEIQVFIENKLMNNSKALNEDSKKDEELFALKLDVDNLKKSEARGSIFYYS